MEIRIFEGSGKVKPQPVRLRLVEYGKNSVMLRAVMEDGNSVASGNLLRFHQDGTTSRCTSVNRKLGFQQDDSGRIVIEGE